MPGLIGLLGSVAACIVLSSRAAQAAVPSSQSIGSGISILTHNDLYGVNARRTSLLVVHTPQTVLQSTASCASFGEEIWQASTNTTDTGLSFLDYGKNTTDVGRYWISVSVQAANKCRAITTRGEYVDLDCDEKLPAICTNSAALSFPGIDDTSAKYQTSVRSKNASFVGYRDKLSFRFLGIRFAKQPQRFDYSSYTPPTPGANISALSYGKQCYQSGCTSSSCSEDCLLLNIWTPYLPSSSAGTGSGSTKKKAVMLWIHGGGFTSGTGSDTTFDGGNLASRGDVVVVTVNYRLSTLGFLALWGSNSNSTVLKGNYGLQDQHTALQWIREHISDFGGDPNRITVFGQSAGAASVRALLASPLAKGKFAGAIMQSNPNGVQYASTFSEYLTIKESTELTKGIFTELSCNQTDSNALLDCLRAQDPVRLVGGRNGAWTGTVARYPVVDSTYLTTPSLPLSPSSPKLSVPILTGNMRDDGDPFSKFSQSKNASQALTEQGFSPSLLQNPSLFPVPNSGNITQDIFNLTSRITTDAEFRCLGQATALAGATNSIFPAVYAYEFDRAYQIAEWSPNPPTCEAPLTSTHPDGDPSLPFYKCHSGELYYVFGTALRQGRKQRDADDVPFSQYIVDTWTAFARNGNPNPEVGYLEARGYVNTTRVVAEAGEWKAVSGERPVVRVLDLVVKDEGFREVEQCRGLGLGVDYYLK